MAVCTAIPAGAVEKNYDNIRSFNALSVSSTFKVNLSQGPECSLRIDVDREYLSYVVAEVKNGCLVLKLNYSKMPVRLRNVSNRVLTAYVTMPDIVELEVSGTANVNASGTFDRKGGEFDCDISGSSKVNGLTVYAGELDAEVSGTSTLVLGGAWDKASLELSGIAKVNLSGNAKTLECDLTGSSDVSASGNYGYVSCDASGESKLRIEGKASGAEYDISGVSSINAGDLPTDDVKMEISGVSKATVNPLKNLRVEVSGMSSVFYIDNEGLKISPVSISGGSTLKAIK